MNPSKPSPLAGGPFRFAGAVSLEEPTGGGVVPWRIPIANRDLFDPALLTRAIMPAGVRIEFVTDATDLRVELSAIEHEGSYSLRYFTLDLVIEGRLHERRTQPLEQAVAVFADLPPDNKRIELYLPQNVALRVMSLSLNRGATIAPWRDPRPRWTVYGSSITQCKDAAGPSEIWPAAVAHRHGLNLTCLGFGGNAHAEPQVAELVGLLPAEYISVCLGINIVYESSLSRRTFRAVVLGFLQKIRERHPATPLAVVTPIVAPAYEQKPNAVGMDLVQARKIIADAVDCLVRRGDGNLHLVDGLELFGPELSGHLYDGLHPNAEGYRVLADRYTRVVMPRLGLPPASAAEGPTPASR